MDDLLTSSRAAWRAYARALAELVEVKKKNRWPAEEEAVVEKARDRLIELGEQP